MRPLCEIVHSKSMQMSPTRLGSMFVRVAACKRRVRHDGSCLGNPVDARCGGQRRPGCTEWKPRYRTGRQGSVRAARLRHGFIQGKPRSEQYAE